MTNNATNSGTNGRISLRDYIDIRFSALDKATVLAYSNLEKQLDGIVSQAYITKEEFDEKMEGLCTDIKSLQISRAELSGKADQRELNQTRVLAIIGTAVGILGTIIAVVSILLRLRGI
jgi:hypothetical protein